MELIVGLPQLPTLLGQRVDPGRVVGLSLGSCCGLSVPLSGISSIELQKIFFLIYGVFELCNLVCVCEGVCV